MNMDGNGADEFACPPWTAGFLGSTRNDGAVEDRHSGRENRNLPELGMVSYRISPQRQSKLGT